VLTPGGATRLDEPIELLRLTTRTSNQKGVCLEEKRRSGGAKRNIIRVVNFKDFTGVVMLM
jgi:hypothetical protein